MSDRFDRRYAMGRVGPAPTPSLPERRRRARPTARAVPGGAFALRGCVLTPDEKIEPGVVVVEGQTIARIVATPPAGVPLVDTGGVILPGLIDLHGHPEFNVFAAWEPPRLYPNRYAWRGSDEYKAVLRDPWSRLTKESDSLIRELTRYAEVRALVGGVTAIQGASGQYPDPAESLVRNVDLPIFGEDVARSAVDLGRLAAPDAARLRAQIDSGGIRAFYVHLAEGLPANARSRDEMNALVAANLLTSATVVIHGTALTDAQLGDLRDAGAKLVWSPQSNLRLYGETTPAAKAIALGLPLGLGADWLPSGSPSLLTEMKVARACLVRQSVGLDPGALHRRLVRAVTADAAAIAGLAGRLGEVAPGRPADLTVLERAFDDPWRSVVDAEPADVSLVTIDGFLVYGRTEWMQHLAPGPEMEPVLAWGRPMTLDTSFAAAASGQPPVRLRDLRKKLIARYPQTGPIFA